MTLALGRPQVSFTWNSDAFLAQAEAQAAEALVLTGEKLVAAIKAQPTYSVLPYDTGALHDSIRVAPPGYRQDDLATVAPDGYGKGVTVPHASGRGRTLPIAMQAHRAVAAPALDPTARVGVDELVQATPERLTTWVGSFLHYAWWQHQGFHHAGRAKTIARERVGTADQSLGTDSYGFIAGRPFIAQIADSEARTFWVASVRAVQRRGR